jgi:hypothetical protein
MIPEIVERIGVRPTMVCLKEIAVFDAKPIAPFWKQSTLDAAGND